MRAGRYCARQQLNIVWLIAGYDPPAQCDSQCGVVRLLRGFG